MVYCIVRNIENVDKSLSKVYYAGLAEQAKLPGWTTNKELCSKYKSRNEARAALAELLAKYTNYMLGAYISDGEI